MNKETVNAVEDLMCASVRHAEVLSGGDLSEVLAMRLDDGREIVAKGGPAPCTEAGMLEAIRAAGVAAPQVLAADARVLVMERIEGEASPGRAWADIGRNLRRLHATTSQSYGWIADYAFGRVAIVNRSSADWPAFWAEQRLMPFVSHVTPDLAQRVEGLCAELPDRLPARPAPALLHGDLWGGNILTHGEHLAAFIDPACYYGHVEVDLAMLTLFDRPPLAFYDAYGALEAGYAARAAIYALWPALVHLRLFGAGYAGLVDRLLLESGF